MQQSVDTGNLDDLDELDEPDELDDASSVLLLAPSMSADEDECCTSLLETPDATDGNVLWVSYTKSPDGQLRRWRAHGHGRPGNLGVVTVGDSVRSTTAQSGSGSSSGPSSPSGPSGPIETVANPNDLTGLGIRLNNYLRRWDGNGRETTICFDSLTAMLQYIDTDTAYEFLHILSGRVHAADARIHFHMDPGAHDDRTVERVVSLCDAVVDLTGDEPAVRSR